MYITKKQHFFRQNYICGHYISQKRKFQWKAKIIVMSEKPTHTDAIESTKNSLASKSDDDTKCTNTISSN